MQQLDDEVRANDLQANFVGNIVLPLWESLVGLLPGVDVMVKGCEDNQAYYRESARVSNPNGGGAK